MLNQISSLLKQTLPKLWMNEVKVRKSSWLRDNEIQQIETPALLLNYERMEKNCCTMWDRATKYNASLRPHVKTLSCTKAATLMTRGARMRIATSNISESEYFADRGFDDILCTKLPEPNVIPRLAKLSRELENFHVMVDSSEHVEMLRDVHQTPWSVFVKINCGKNRAGIDYDDEYLGCLAKLIVQRKIKFHGLYVYCGNSYDSAKDDRKQLTNETVNKLMYAVRRLREDGHLVPVYGIGSTPTCSEDNDSISEINELHPGNYIVYDAQQLGLSSCREDDVALAVATRVIGIYPQRKQVIVDCGFNRLSKQKNPSEDNFGNILNLPGWRITTLSQESGVVQFKGQSPNFSDIRLGKLLFVTPYHACATACMFQQYHVFRNGRLSEIWRRREVT